MGVLNCWRNLCEDEVNTLRFVSLGFQSLVAFNSSGISSVDALWASILSG